MILPPEITAQVLTYLDVTTLLRSTELSKSWRIRSLDPPVWKKLFIHEGWKANMAQVWEFEEAQRQREAEKQKGKTRARPADAVSDIESKSPKRLARRTSANHDVLMAGSEAIDWAEQHGHVEADEDEKMEDINDEPRLWPSRDAASGLPSIYPPIRPSLLVQEYGTAPQINWQYLFKQKQRLEENWQANRHTNFQLPHPSHPHEAHAECIYTIQFHGKHLVSGSRDKTLRVWNLDTQRLILPPLRGHDASVLCLQFDSSPKNDVIISGGSDSNVIIWQFSTGKLLHKIEKAHRDPVLNLRFDDEYLVTCSKDMLIKVWNRHSLLPTDSAYPTRVLGASAHYPEHIISVDLEDLKRRTFEPLKEYSLLMSLRGHSAAVNAVQVFEGKIVSASGDRQIKMWDIRSGSCIRTIFGHSKGIACVQYDGRRIISGSSDESVRIFDSTTGAEVACLKGHSDLVRTVQARWGDVPGSEADQAAEARTIDRSYLTAATRAGGFDHMELTKEQWRARGTGGRDPTELFSYGAKLPPGGGGGRWARIVSGSYDETIIIWTRNAKGEWIKAHQLTQWDAVARAGGQPRVLPPPQTTRERRRAQRAMAQRLIGIQQQQERARRQAQQVQARQQHAQAQQMQTEDSENRPRLYRSAADAATSTDQMSPNQSEPSTQESPEIPAVTSIPHPPAVSAAQMASAVSNRHHLRQAAQAQQQAQQQAHAAHHGTQAAANSRVYKLQFDARRIICCSTEPTILGWDYANGDIDIEIASEFFAEDT
jgi:F-box and WD-40 domain protein 1/11